MSQISFFFFLTVKYSQRASNAYNAYFIHKTISVHDKIAQIHTNTQRKVIVTSYTPAERYKTAQLCNGTICCAFSSHRLVHDKLTRCCTTHNITFADHRVPGRTTWMHMSFCRELIFLQYMGLEQLLWHIRTEKLCFSFSQERYINRPYVLTSSRHHVGGRSHCLAHACDLLLAHCWQLRLRVILYPPNWGRNEMTSYAWKVYNDFNLRSVTNYVRSPWASW